MKQDLKKVFELLVTPKMRLLIPQIMWTGISISYYSGLLTLTIVSTVDSTDEKIQFQKSMLAMMMFGVGSFIGTSSLGYICDNFSKKVGVFTNITYMLFMTIVSLNFIYQYKYSWLAFLMAFVWGLQDGAIYTHIC